jgi:thioredoxin reductase
MDDAYDVAIVGAGPAGLSAALVLGRCRERVIVLDDGKPRNAHACRSHGFYSRDGASPALLRSEAIAQLAPYGVRVKSAHVSSVDRIEGGFELASGRERWRARKLLLATGLRESETGIPGITDRIGDGVYCCPYCDGWEVRDLALGGLAMGEGAAEYALGLRTWSERVTLFTNGRAALSDEDRAKLTRNRVTWIEKTVERVVASEPGRVRGVQLAGGGFVEVDALFIHAGQYQHSELARSLGCEVVEDVKMRTGRHRSTCVSGLYVAGDAAAQVNSIAMAAADGYEAALAIHAELRRERTG